MVTPQYLKHIQKHSRPRLNKIISLRTVGGVKMPANIGLLQVSVGLK